MVMVNISVIALCFFFDRYLDARAVRCLDFAAIKSLKPGTETAAGVREVASGTAALASPPSHGFFPQLGQNLQLSHPCATALAKHSSLARCTCAIPVPIFGLCRHVRYQYFLTLFQSWLLCFALGCTSEIDCCVSEKIAVFRERLSCISIDCCVSDQSVVYSQWFWFVFCPCGPP